MVEIGATVSIECRLIGTNLKGSAIDRFNRQVIAEALGIWNWSEVKPTKRIGLLQRIYIGCCQGYRILWGGAQDEHEGTVQPCPSRDIHLDSLQPIIESQECLTCGP